MTVDNDNVDNPYRAPREASWPPAVPGALQASLIERANLGGAGASSVFETRPVIAHG
jgi:hypothetical protein